MSIKVMSRVWEKSKHGGSQLLLLLAIADNANDSGFAWPGQEYLAKKIKMNKRSISRLTKKLQDSRELFINVRSDKGKSTQYIILIGMTWADFVASLQAYLKYTPEECADIYPWFCDRGDDKLSTPKEGGVDIAMSRGDDKLSGGVDIAMSTEPSLTINKTSFDNGSAKISRPDDERKDRLNAIADQIAAICKIDIDIASPRVREDIKRITLALNAKSVEVADLKHFSDWWYNKYWAGKKGQAPTPAQIGDTWGQFEATQTNTSTGPTLSEAEKKRLAELTAQFNQN